MKTLDKTKTKFTHIYNQLFSLGFEIDDACLTINYCIDSGVQFGMWKLIAPKCVPKKKC